VAVQSGAPANPVIVKLAGFPGDACAEAGDTFPEVQESVTVTAAVLLSE
jgi:hypothetical protein